jgi:general stress protein YciG
MKPRGFAAIDKARAYAIRSEGGKAVQAQGTGHRWTAEAARAAGRKGAAARARNAEQSLACYWRRKGQRLWAALKVPA